MKSSVLIIALVFAGNIPGYTQHESQSSGLPGLGFEDESGWYSGDSVLWEFSQNRATEGIQSLKYSVRGGSVGTSALWSIDTEHTIMMVRTARLATGITLVATSYEGTAMAVDYSGAILWKNPLSGFENHDLWCEDITGDGIDEILAANADGTIYCLDGRGTVMWSFSVNEAPMLSVCVVQKDGVPYVACGGFDLNIYYLKATGEMVKELGSSVYSVEKTWGDGRKPIPPSCTHVANFLRKVVRPDGTEILAMHGTNNKAQGRGSVYLFEPLADRPFSIHKLAKEEITDMPGDFRPCYINDTLSFLLGTSGHYKSAALCVYKPAAGSAAKFPILHSHISGLAGFGYRMVQSELIPDGDGHKIFTLYGQRILLLPTDLDAGEAEVLASAHTYNDMCYDAENHKMIFASCQSGGSCIHIIDLNDPGWKQAYRELVPPGKIRKIKENSAQIRMNLQGFGKPDWQREQLPVYLMSEKKLETVQDVVDDINANHTSPVFLTYGSSDREDWDRAEIENEVYRNKRDGRMKYILTQQQVLEAYASCYQGDPEGVVYWGGHGNDPYFYSVDTKKKLFDMGGDSVMTIQIYPEMGDYTSDFDYVLDDLFYRLAEYIRDSSLTGKFYIRSKSPFWQSGAYLPGWSRVRSGEFADIFIPALEETGDKSHDISVAGRMGIWASGATESWGARCARDNASYFGTRKRCDQNLPSNFLRHMIYNIACGAQYINNFTVDQTYMSLLWELIAKGVLYVPERSELLNISPVHLSMFDPDSAYLDESTNVKFITFYHINNEKENPKVFNRLNGSWFGAPVTEWDFSRYASTVKERRINFMPSYENGIVLITPPQAGVHADTTAIRGALADHLHPIYKDIMKEYYTDGRNYYSADGTETYGADEYYSTIESDIKASVRHLPLTVKSGGTVAWVVAQTAPTHLRLTLIDGSYINPDDRVATVRFHAVNPVAMTDLLDGTRFHPSDPSGVRVEIPCGGFRFIEIELDEPLD